MRRWAGCLLLMAIAAAPFGASAQTGVRLESAEMALWPEYDRPGVLVIYRLAIDASVPLPTALVVSLPAAVGEPNAVAERVGDGLMSLAYDREVSGEMAQLRFVAGSRTVQVEYYDTGLARDGSRRSYQHVWPGDYAVASLSASVQHPWGSRDVIIEPAAGPPHVGNDTLGYQRLEFGAVAAGQQRVVRLQYDKDGDGLSASALPPVPAPAPLPAPDREVADRPPDTGAALTTRVFEILLVLGLAGLILGLLLRRRPGPAQDAAPGSRFCTRCGRGAARGDRFCGRCGASLPIS